MGGRCFFIVVRRGLLPVRLAGLGLRCGSLAIFVQFTLAARGIKPLFAFGISLAEVLAGSGV